jgi:glycerophosphoryl diester phosphodiesterase
MAGRRIVVGAKHPVLSGGPLLIAHRGGAALAPENTLVAFRQAIDDWGADMVELDVRASADGRCMVIHDPTVDRTTDGTGAVEAMTYDELRRLDAGYRFTPDGGRSFPFRGRGIRIPTIEEVLEALPTIPLTVEVKVAAAARPLFEAIERVGAAGRIVAAAEEDRCRALFGSYPGPLSASRSQMLRFFLLHHARLSAFWQPAVDAVQIPERWRGRQLLTPRLVRDFHARGFAVHVWTVNEVDDMERLLEWGVDGLVTDYPDRLADLLAARWGRAPAPARRRGASLPVE